MQSKRGGVSWKGFPSYSVENVKVIYIFLSLSIKYQMNSVNAIPHSSSVEHLKL